MIALRIVTNMLKRFNPVEKLKEVAKHGGGVLDDLCHCKGKRILKNGALCNKCNRVIHDMTLAERIKLKRAKYNKMLT